MRTNPKREREMRKMETNQKKEKVVWKSKSK